MRSLKIAIDYILCFFGATIGYDSLDHARTVYENAAYSNDLKDFIKVAITAAVPLIIKESVLQCKKALAAIKERKNNAGQN